MLQRLATVMALVASAAALADAVNVHVKVVHPARAATPKPMATPTSTPETEAEAVAVAASSSSSSEDSEDGAWQFSPVKSIQARVQGNAPTWDAKTKTWVASFGKTYDEQFRSVLDTVNTASVEGALMYVQAEGINAKEQSVKCERKNQMQYVVFYEIEVAQPSAAVAFYGARHSTPEYCPFVAMDSGACTKAGDDVPDTCKQFDGLDGQPELGHCVGANEQTTDPRAPYPGNYWFSFPNSCVTKGWKDKTDACRTEFAGGLCPAGQSPDGETCTFSYKILGYLDIDDLVGITDGTADGTTYGNFTEFCQAGGVEFLAENTASGFKVQQSIPFWENPSDEEANAARTKSMIEKYNMFAPEATEGDMEPLPEIATLAESNPACYLNAKECATAKNGCRRVLYSQLCEICEAAGDECVVAPKDYVFPELKVPEAESTDDSESSDSGLDVDASGSTDGSVEDVTPSPDASTPVPATSLPASAAVSSLVSTAALAFSALAATLL